MTKRVLVGDGTDGIDKVRQCSGSSQGPSSDSEKEDLPPAFKNITLWQYLYIELTRGYWLEYDKAKFTERRKRVYTFLKIPQELEKFIIYGFFQCVDGFLFLFTFLPLRLLKTLFKIFVSCCIRFSWPTIGRVLDPAEICDLLKAVILIVCYIMMTYIDVSMMYHIIRGQTIIKLYIFFNMLDIADKLFTSFGQDILDALFWTATEPRSRRREHVGVVPHLLLAIIYVFLHAMLVLFQANTLNVAFNSHNKSLLTIMMSNNFVELKASVFKKFERNNLFQMSCSDVRERFHFIVLLSIVCVRNLTEFSWNTEHFWILIPDIALVLLAEFLVDWVKHAFITKFNEIPYEVYREYTISIAYDMANTRHATAFSDHLDTISRRMGFIPLPLAVLLIRVLGHSVPLRDPFSYMLAGLLFLCLVTFKILNSIVLLGKSREHIEENRRNLAAAAARSSESKGVPHPSEPKPTSKDDLDLPPTKSSEMGDVEPQEPSFRRTQSLGDFSSAGEDVQISSTASVEDLSGGGKVTLPLPGSDPCGMPRQMSFAAGHLLSNSTVSLISVGMNEDFLEQQQHLELQQLQQEQLELRKRLEFKAQQQQRLEQQQQQLLEMKQQHHQELKQLQQLQEFRIQQQKLEEQQQLMFNSKQLSDQPLQLVEELLSEQQLLHGGQQQQHLQNDDIEALNQQEGKQQQQQLKNSEQDPLRENQQLENSEQELLYDKILQVKDEGTKILQVKDEGTESGRANTCFKDVSIRNDKADSSVCSELATEQDDEEDAYVGRGFVMGDGMKANSICDEKMKQLAPLFDQAVKSSSTQMILQQQEVQQKDGKEVQQKEPQGEVQKKEVQQGEVQKEVPMGEVQQKEVQKKEVQKKEVHWKWWTELQQKGQKVLHQKEVKQEELQTEVQKEVQVEQEVQKKEVQPKEAST